MKGWNQVKLEDITTKIGDGLHGTPKYCDTGEYFFINGNNLKNGKINIKEDTKRIDKFEYKKIIKELNDRTILVAINGTLGNVGLYNGEKVALGKSACYFNINKGVDKHYIRYVVENSKFQNYAQSAATGATIKNLSLKAMREYTFFLPAFSTQTQIASVISSYDDLVENNQKRIKILEEMAQRLYAEWFVNFKFPRHGKVKMIDSGTEFGMIPEGWRLEKIKQVARVNDSSIKKQNAPEIINYISIADVSTGKIDNQEVLKFSKAPSRARRIINHGDIIWSTVRPNRKSYALLLYPDQNTVVSTGFAVLTSKDVSFSYLYHWTTAQKFVDYLVNNAKGSAYPAVSGSDFEKAEILIPSKDVQRMFADIVDKYYEDKNILEKLNVDLSKSRDLLIENLVTGKKLLKK